MTRTRIDLGNVQDLAVGNAVNRSAKRDRADVVETPGLPLGMTREALGQALLLGYGDKIEGALADRNPEDIRRERNAFSDEHPVAANGAYVGGLLAGGMAPKIIKLLASGGRATPEEALPRFQPDLRQAMRNADQVESVNRPADSQRDALDRLLSSPEARADIRGQPLELSPSDIFSMLAGADENAIPGMGPGRENVVSPEEEALRALSPTDALKFGQQLQEATPVSDEQRQQNLRTTGMDALSVTPGPGNIMAAQDAFQGAKDAYGEFSHGNVKGGLLDSALAALSGVGAVTGLPSSKMAGRVAKDAKDTASVFLPLTPGSRASNEVLSQRLDGRQLRDIYRDTGNFMGPDGVPRREIVDGAMHVRPEKAVKGQTLPLGDLIEHPALFEARPQYRDIPVKLTESMSGYNPVARTVGDAFENSVIGDMKPGIAKNLQYAIARDSQLPASLRHGKDAIPEGISAALKSLEGVPVESSADRRALAAYVERLQNVRGDYLGDYAMADPKKQLRVEEIAGRKSAGNADSRIVRARAGIDADKVREIYPYAQRPSYLPRQTGKGVPPFEEIWPLPPEKASGEDLMEFIRNWHKYGSGRPPGVAD